VVVIDDLAEKEAAVVVVRLTEIERLGDAVPVWERDPVIERETVVEPDIVFDEVPERLAVPVKDAEPVRLCVSEGLGGLVPVGIAVRLLIGEAVPEGERLVDLDPEGDVELRADLEADVVTVSERVMRILGEPEGDPETDFVAFMEPEGERVAPGDRVPEALRETDAEPVGEREFVVETVDVFEDELVRVPEGLPETDFVARVVVLADIVTVAERLPLTDPDEHTDGVPERLCLIDAEAYEELVPERLLAAERVVETDAETVLEEDVEGVTDCVPLREGDGTELNEPLSVEKTLGVGSTEISAVRDCLDVWVITAEERGDRVPVEDLVLVDVGIVDRVPVGVRVLV
jgi:hypothetical protein